MVLITYDHNESRLFDEQFKANFTQIHQSKLAFAKTSVIFGSALYFYILIHDCTHSMSCFAFTDLR